MISEKLKIRQQVPAKRKRRQRFRSSYTNPGTFRHFSDILLKGSVFRFKKFLKG